MPTYQYACKETACGHRFEAVQSFSDEPIAVCPVCEGQVRKVFSTVGIVFKGSGFYRTDSRENAKSTNGSSPKESSSVSSTIVADSASDSTSSPRPRARSSNQQAGAWDRRDRRPE